MQTLEIQNILNELYTKKQCRELFAKDRQLFVSKYKALSSESISFLNELNPEQIEFFANGLLSKRLHAVKDLLPVSSYLMKGNFRTSFFVFSETYLPAGIHKHHEDAIAFCAYLQKQTSLKNELLLNDLIDFEKHQVMNFLEPIRFKIKGYKFNPIYTQQQIKSGKKMDGLEKRKSLFLWKNGRCRLIW